LDQLGWADRHGSSVARSATCTGRLHRSSGSPAARTIVAEYRRIIANRGRNIGVVAAARRLLTYVYYDLRDGEIRALAKGVA
jgi:hypothetical protein